jgi:transposase-like protein
MSTKERTSYTKEQREDAIKAVADYQAANPTVKKGAAIKAVAEKLKIKVPTLTLWNTTPRSESSPRQTSKKAPKESQEDKDKRLVNLLASQGIEASVIIKITAKDEPVRSVEIAGNAGKWKWIVNESPEKLEDGQVILETGNQACVRILLSEFLRIIKK